MKNVKSKERIFKSNKRKAVICNKVPIRLAADFSTKVGQKGLARNIQNDEKQEPTTKITLPSKAIT